LKSNVECFSFSTARTRNIATGAFGNRILSDPSGFFSDGSAFISEEHPLGSFRVRLLNAPYKYSHSLLLKTILYDDNAGHARQVLHDNLENKNLLYTFSITLRSEVKTAART
jgi:hypothetical protein